MYQYIENSNIINRFFGDGPFPSGAGSIPYNVGWANKYSPRPFGLQVSPQDYSRYANNGVQNSGHYTNIASRFSPSFFGAINSIYEVEVSGITGNGKCIDCDSLNQKYLLYSLNDNLHLYHGPGQMRTDNFAWWSYVCNNNRPINLCNVTRSKLIFGLIPNTNSVSGELCLRFILERNRAASTGNIVFQKSFGYINTNNASENYKKPYMMDGEHFLYPSGVDNTQYIGTFNVSIGDDLWHGDNTVDSLTCNISGAVAIVRPYKNGFFDVKQSLWGFNSGQFIPIQDYLFDGRNGNLDYGSFLQDVNNVGPCDNFYKNVPNYTKLITSLTNVRSENSGYAYKFFPSLFQFSVEGLSGVSVNLDRNCRRCDEFYSKPKNLSINAISYTFLGIGLYDFEQGSYNYGFTPTALHPLMGNQILTDNYNICDSACGSWGAIFGSGGANYNRPFSFDHGPCNNLIDLYIEYSGNYQFGYRMLATLSFGAFFNSGIFNGANDNSNYAKTEARYSPYILTKTICDDTGPNKCTQGIYFSGVIVPTISYGLKNCFDSGIFSGGWTKILRPASDTRGRVFETFSRRPLAPELDVLQYCPFESGNIVLKPAIESRAPCAVKRCNIYNNNYVPQTLIVRFTQGTLPANIPASSGFGTRTLMVPIVAGNCIWRLDTVQYPTLSNPISTGNYVEVDWARYATVSSGYAMFGFTSRLGVSNSGWWQLNSQSFSSPDGNISPGHTISVSGYNLSGGLPSVSGIDSRTVIMKLVKYVYNSGTQAFTEENVGSNTCTATVDFQFTDEYNILDYL